MTRSSKEIFEYTQNEYKKIKKTIKIKLPKEDMLRIIKHGKAKKQYCIDFEKEHGRHPYGNDNKNIHIRFAKGLSGEIGVGIQLGVKIADETIGSSIKYNKPDMHKVPGCENVGVKIIDSRYLPVISKSQKNIHSQVLVAYKEVTSGEYWLEDDNGKKVYLSDEIEILGYISKDNILKYNSDEFIINPKMKHKTAISNLGVVLFFSTMEELINCQTNSD